MLVNSFLFSALCVGPAAAVKIRAVTAQPEFDPLLNLTRCTAEDTSGKDIDVLLYGVTGFAGKRAAMYLARNIASEHVDFRWAIAGRDKTKLDSIKTLAATSNPNPPEQLHFGLENEEEVLQMVRRARVVVNFAGPYEVNRGEVVIRAALRGCAHYVDIAEELNWKSLMLMRYGEQAAKRGVVVVQSAGFRSMASEMLAMSAALDAQAVQHAPPTNVMVVWTTLNGAPSGGQRATDNYDRMHHRKLQDPHVLVPEIAEDMKVDQSMDGMENKPYNGKRTVSIDPKAALDCSHVRRAMLTEFPASPISVQQGFTDQVGPKRKAFLETTFNFTKHPEWRVNENPLPGEGPPFWVLQRGSFEGYAVAWTESASPGNAMGAESAKKGTRVTMKGHGDPFFLGSARMATEVAIGLALPGPGDHDTGFLTPTGALGMRVLEGRFEQLDEGTWLRIYHENHR